MISATVLLYLLVHYGDLTVQFVAALKSMEVSAPGETILLTASVIAGTTRELPLPLVITAAASGAIMGDNVGYWVGRTGDTYLLRRYGHLIPFISANANSDFISSGNMEVKLSSWGDLSRVTLERFSSIHEHQKGSISQ